MVSHFYCPLRARGGGKLRHPGNKVVTDSLIDIDCYSEIIQND